MGKTFSTHTQRLQTGGGGGRVWGCMFGGGGGDVQNLLSSHLLSLYSLEIKELVKLF